jgi:hypothetical protein
VEFSARQLGGVFLEQVEQLQAPLQQDLEVLKAADTPPAYSSMSFCRRNMNMHGTDVLGVDVGIGGEALVLGEQIQRGKGLGLELLDLGVVHVGLGVRCPDVADGRLAG